MLQLPEEDGRAERRRVQQFPLLHQLQGPVAKLAGSGPSTLAVSVPDASREADESLRWVRDHVMGLQAKGTVMGGQHTHENVHSGRF